MKMSMEQLMEMLSEKKEGKKGSDERDLQAKMDVLDELRQIAEDQMGEEMLDGMKSVKVMAKDEEGLKSGLEKAQDLVGDMDEMSDMEKDVMDGMSLEDMMEDDEEEEDEEEEEG